MATTYSGDETNNPASITIPSDGDDADVSSVNVALEGLMDKVEHALTGDTEFDGLKVFQSVIELAAGLLFTGAITGSTVPGAGGLDRVLIADLPLEGGTRRLRFYTRASGSTAYPSSGLDVTVNARWDAGSEDWRRDNASNAYLYELFCVATGWSSITNLDGDGATLTIKTKVSAPSAWDHDSWDPLILALNPSNPTPTSSAIIANTIYPKSICKAWGRVSVTGGGGTVTVRDGIGLASVVVDSASLLVTLQKAMSNIYYAPVAQSHSSAYITITSVMTTTQFRVEFRGFPGGDNLDPATNNSECSFHVKGEQS